MNCPKCDSTVLAHHRFCAACGNGLGHSAEAVRRSEERMDTGLLALGAALLICCGFFFFLH